MRCSLIRPIENGSSCALRWLAFGRIKCPNDKLARALSSNTFGIILFVAQNLFLNHEYQDKVYDVIIWSNIIYFFIFSAMSKRSQINLNTEVNKIPINLSDRIVIKHINAQNIVPKIDEIKLSICKMKT